MSGHLPSTMAAQDVLAPIRTAQWHVILTDTAVPVRIDYLADIHTENGLALSLTEFWHIGSRSLKIISSDFAYSELDEYHYFFKQKTESGFFRSKRKTVEKERRSAEAHHESRSSIGVYHFGDNHIDAEIAENSWRNSIPTVEELDGGAGRSANPASGPRERVSAAPIRLFESAHKTPWCKLSIVFAGLAGTRRRIVLQSCRWY